MKRDAWTAALQQLAGGGAQDSPSATAASPRSVPRSSFDFAASSWTAKQRENRIALGVVAGVVLVVAGLGWYGWHAGNTASERLARATTLRDEWTGIQEQIRGITGGVENLPALVAEQQTAVDYAIGTDCSESAVLDVLTGTFVEGLTVKSISITNAAEAIASTEAPFKAFCAVEISATGGSLEVPARWQAALTALAGTKLENPEVSYSVTGGGAVDIAMRAGVSDEVAQPRRVESRKDVGLPPATTAPAAGSTTTSPASEGGADE